MRSSNTIYSGRTTLGTETFGKLTGGETAGEQIVTKRVRSTYCVPSRCTKVINYDELNTLNASIRIKYLTNQNAIKNQKNSLVSGLYTELDLNNVNVVANSTTRVSPATISTTSKPYLDYTIDPSGKLFGNTVCGLNNFVNYKVGNNYTLNRILKL